MYPENLKYSREHEWVRLEGDQATVGITAHAQEEMGDLVFIELPRVGTRLEAGKPMGTVESVKAVSEVFAPVGGEVVEVNPALADAPDLVNRDPHGAGWMARLRLAAPGEPPGLMTAAEYEAFLAAGA
jgi:glycine cleavage system H protein